MTTIQAQHTLPSAAKTLSGVALAAASGFSASLPSLCGT